MTTDRTTANSWRPGKRVAIIGAGPGGVSAALGFLSRGFDVRIFERRPVCTPIGGGVLLATPVLAILRSYGVPIEDFGLPTITSFRNNKGHIRVEIPVNHEVEKRMGIKGWHYGVLRSSGFAQILALVPEGIIQTSHEFVAYTELEDTNEVKLAFKDGKEVRADIVIAGDGIRSKVSQQAFGDPGLFHTGIRLYLAWCDQLPGVSKERGSIHHSRRHQASYFPMMHEGKPATEWWVVEPSGEGMSPPKDIEAHVKNILKEFEDPLPRLAEATNFASQVFTWEVYNRPSLKKWSRGRMVGLGDAVHPVSPYAAYGMGMAIEDGYYLARALDGVDLSDLQAVSAGYEIYEQERVDYVNHNVELARKLGNVFHNMPWPLTYIRDLVLDYTPYLKWTVAKDHYEMAEKATVGLRELELH
jgi:2-polyprenyl-6-methoxyphenol hydroxylase-like FAD-dependent oxidoreductase